MDEVNLRLGKSKREFAMHAKASPLTRDVGTNTTSKSASKESGTKDAHKVSDAFRVLTSTQKNKKGLLDTENRTKSDHKIVI